MIRTINSYQRGMRLARKREECRLDSGGPVTRRYLEVNVVFFVTAGVTILFLHNWFSLLAFGGDSLDGNHQAWVIWAAVEYVAATGLGRHRLPALARGIRLLAGTVDSGALEVAWPCGTGACA